MIRFCVVAALFAIVIVVVPVIVPAATIGPASAQPAAGAVTVADGGTAHPPFTGLIVRAFAAVSVQPVSTFKYVTLTVIGRSCVPASPPTVQGALGNVKLVGNVTLNVTGDTPSGVLCGVPKTVLSPI